MENFSADSTNNPGSDPISYERRTGASQNDLHGSHESASEWKGPDPDPIDELVPAGAGALPATKSSVSEQTESLAYTDSQRPNVLDGLAGVNGMATLDAKAQPGFGPTELDLPQIEGNPELGIDPHDVRDDMPPRETGIPVKGA